MSNDPTELTNILSRLSEVDGRLGDLARIAIQKVGALEAMVAHYQKENQELADENESLWFMIDELKESQKFSAEHSKYLEESVKKQILQLKLKKNNKGEA